MPAQRATWTDERLDDLSTRVEKGFDRVDSRFAQVDARLNSLEARMDARFDSLQRTIVQLGGGMLATMIVGFAGVIATR